MIPMSTKIIKNLNKKDEFYREKQYIDAMRAQLSFLTHSEGELKQYSKGVLQIQEITCLNYCMIKLFLILLQRYQDHMTPESLNKQK